MIGKYLVSSFVPLSLFVLLGCGPTRVGNTSTIWHRDQMLPVTFGSEEATQLQRNTKPDAQSAVVYVVRRKDTLFSVLREGHDIVTDQGGGFTKIEINGTYCSMLVPKTFCVAKVPAGKAMIRAIVCGETGYVLVLPYEKGEPVWAQSYRTILEAGQTYYFTVALDSTRVQLRQIVATEGKTLVEQARICTSKPRAE